MSSFIFFYFANLAFEIVTNNLYSEADIRLMNLIAAYRSLAIAKILLLFTYLGNWQIMVTLGIIIVVILRLLKERRKLFFFIIGLIGSGLFYNLLKLIFHRQRPEAVFSLIVQNGYSFPSGHAVMAVVFYGLIGYILLKNIKHWRSKLLLAILIIGLILLVGFSRVYLGVHWTTDILAGWLLGLALLILIITFFKNQERYRPETKANRILGKKFIVLMVCSLFMIEGIFFYYFYKTHPLIEPPVNNLEKITIASAVNLPGIALVDNFPKFSENLAGQKMEPISFVFIGSREKIVQIFKQAGWDLVDEPRRLANLYRLAAAALFNRSYIGAPVTPAFLKTQPNALAFEKPTAAQTVRQRHHIRFWPTEFFWRGAEVWVATASFDDGLRYLIAHKIRPNIDVERDYIKSDLEKTGLIKEAEQIQLVEPLLGKNQSGDQFFTDGKTYLLLLK